MAFSQTSKRLMAAIRNDVQPALVKWWKSHSDTKVDGMITRQLSPFVQKPVMPWLKTFPELAFKKFTRSVPYWGGAVAIVWGTVTWGDWADDQQSRAHRF